MCIRDRYKDKMPFNGFMNIVHFTLLATHCIDIDIEEDACPGVTLFAASDQNTETIFPHKWEMLYQARFPMTFCFFLLRNQLVGECMCGWICGHVVCGTACMSGVGHLPCAVCQVCALLQPAMS